MPKINRETLGEGWLWYPELPEQDAILRSIREATLPFDAASGQAEREIALLREYRTRLIADVVTGRFDAREAAANLPNEFGDAPPEGGVGEADDIVDDDGLDTADDEAVA